MTIDVVDLHEFYRTPIGAVARHLLMEKLALRWKSMAYAGQIRNNFGPNGQSPVS